jgi:predicted amidohydrolase YtcJ
MEGLHMTAEVNRRAFLKLVTCLGLPIRGFGEELPSPKADLAILNGRLITLDPAKPEAEAALVRAGRIVLVGTDEEVRAESASASVFDAAGRAVVPGFIDSHVHLELASAASEYQVPCHAPPFTSLHEIRRALAAKAADTPAGRWVVGRSSYNLAGKVSEGRMPTRQELDSVTDKHPLILFSGLHIASLNRRGFEELGLWNPASEMNLRWRDGRPRVGTVVHRDGAGEPTGLATEVADLLYGKEIYSIEEIREAIATHARRLFVAKGITSVATIATSGKDLRAVQLAQRAGQLPLRVRFYYRVPMTIAMRDVLASGLLPGAGDDRFRFGGIKIFVDGTGEDGLGNVLEDLKWTRDELADNLSQAQEAGLQALLHVVTPGGLSLALDAVEEAQRRHPRSLRPRLEHASVVRSEAEIRRLQDLGIRISITRSTRGEARLRTPPPYPALVRAGLKPVSISDSTGTIPEFSPLAGIASLVALPQDGGIFPEGKALGFEDALRTYTAWAAESLFEEDDKGSITPGKLGDFAVLSFDPRGRPSGEWFDLKVDATILGGEPVFERS